MKNKRYLIIAISIIVISFIIGSCSYKNRLTASDIKLAPLYGSNMVFRSGDSIVVHGISSKKGTLAVSLQNGLKYVQSDANGNWRVSFPPINYKGEFSIKVEGETESIELTNLTIGKIWVVIGDVWLNKPLLYSNENKLQHNIEANNDVRVYTPNSIQVTGENSIQGNWNNISNSKITYRELFSIVLGDVLNEKLDEPIGIINLAYPETNTLNFSNAGRLKHDSVYSEVHIDSIWNAYHSRLKEYKLLADSSFRGIERDVLNRYYDDWEWSEIPMPIITSRRWYLKDKITWFRKKIYVAEKYLTSDFSIELGALRGHFDFYFNGKHLSNFQGESRNYTLTVPDSLLKVWTNLLTVRMVAGDSLSGLYSSSPRMLNADSSYNSLIADEWLVRTFYEPGLPNIKRPKYLWPHVYEYYLSVFNSLNVDAVVVAGGINQYLYANSISQQEMLHEVDKRFHSESKYFYLLPMPTFVDSLTNSPKYDAIRNNQLIAAAKEGWQTINTLDIEQLEDIQGFYIDLSKSLVVLLP